VIQAPDEPGTEQHAEHLFHCSAALFVFASGAAPAVFVALRWPGESAVLVVSFPE
jgi:hypothetical protein